MKIAILSKRTVTSKKNGETYTIVSGFNASGKTLEVFLNTEQVDGLTLAVPSKRDLEEMFSSLPLMNVEFNDQGRVEEVSEEETDE